MVRRLTTAILIFVILGGGFFFLFTNGNLAGYSAGITSCTTFNDALTGESSQYCSSLTALPVTGSVTALTPSGKNFTFYDSGSGKSAPLATDARLTLSAQYATPLGYSVSSTCTALVDGKQAATNSTKNVLYTSLNGAKICVISIDGKVLQSYFSASTSEHLVQYSLAGKATAIFPTGATQSRSFSGSLGNVTITITNPTSTTVASTEETVSPNTISLPQIQAPSGVQVGSSQNAVMTSTSVPPVTAPVISPTTNAVNPDYVKGVETIISSSSANVPIQVQAGTSTITVNACDVGSCSYSPPSTGESQATVTAQVSRDDIASYERDSQQVLNQFGAKSVDDLTPYSRCAYFRQC